MAPRETATDSGPFLTGREWLWVAASTALVVAALPWCWHAVERFGFLPDHRIPYALSEDYWYFERWSERAAATADVLVLGDSVVWGAYAARDQTLSHWLTALDGRKFANLGFNGGHPAALEGMLRHHGHAIADKTVVLHCNLLWLASPRQDLSDDKEAAFHHSDLVPQFDGGITVYRADLSRRLGLAIEQRLPFFTLMRHLRQAHFGGLDLPSWSLEHPYRLAPESAPVPGDGPAEPPRSWTERGMEPQDFDWVEPSRSLQWRFFRSAVRRLQAAGNRVVVLVGPFNVHLLEPEGRAGWERLRAAVAQWLTEREVAVLLPDPLSSHLYADASHPLGAGYRWLAEHIEIPRD